VTSLDRGADLLGAGVGAPAPARRVGLAAVPVAFLLIRPAVRARAATH